MVSYDLNEMLKKKNTDAAADSEVKLDDVARVRILSPGRQVFKRFIRNRLAVFGSVLLITMFVFAFLGPVIYPYGQKDIFYKYDTQNVNYALAKENTSYSGYALDKDTEIPRSVSTNINSLIKRMIQADAQSAMLGSGDEAFVLERSSDDIFVLNSVKAETVASVGEGDVRVGTYDSIKDSIEFAGKAVDGLEDALRSSFNKAGGQFVHEGVTYTYSKAKAKSYDVFMAADGVRYTGDDMDASFEKAFTDAAGSGAFSFDNGGTTYYVVESDNGHDAVAAGSGKTVSVYTRLVFNSYETGKTISDDIKAGALMHMYDAAPFEVDGSSYHIQADGDKTVLYEGDSATAELSRYSIRRYTGEDSIDYDLKKEIEGCITRMSESGAASDHLTYDLPMQNEDGSYSYDENGQLQYVETEMKISRRDTGEYVINCDQIIYVIDMFSMSSSKHLLGTDGDGFDVLARIMYGGRVSLMVGFVVVFLETILGVVMGGLAGYYGGWVDNLIMRLVDIFYCLPSLPIMIILGAMMDALRMDTYIRLLIMMATLGILGWASVARMVRGQILSLREQEFMVAAEATGIRVKDRIFRHLIPNVMPQLIVIATMGMGSVILTESTLSFLGLGVKHPLATWGTIINSVSSATAMAHYPHIWIPVGLLICLTVIAFNFVGDGLRDAYDPKSKG